MRFIYKDIYSAVVPCGTTKILLEIWLHNGCVLCYLAAFICFATNDVKIGWKRPRDDPVRLIRVIARRNFIIAGEQEN